MEPNEITIVLISVVGALIAISLICKAAVAIYAPPNYVEETVDEEKAITKRMWKKLKKRIHKLEEYSGETNEAILELGTELGEAKLGNKFFRDTMAAAKEHNLDDPKIEKVSAWVNKCFLTGMDRDFEDKLKDPPDEEDEEEHLGMNAMDFDERLDTYKRRHEFARYDSFTQMFEGLQKLVDSGVVDSTKKASFNFRKGFDGEICCIFHYNELKQENKQEPDKKE